MNVAELITALSALDQSLTVVVDGYEDGFAEKIEVAEVYIKKNGNGEHDGIYGRHSRTGSNAKIMEGNWNMIAAYIGEGRNLGSGT